MLLRTALAGLFLLSLGPVVAAAGPAEPAEAPPSPREWMAEAARDPAEREPLPVPPPTPKAVRYVRTGAYLWAASRVWDLVVPAALLVSGLSARLWSVSRRVGRVWLPSVMVYLALFLLVTFAADLPLRYYSGFVRQHAYGLSNQTFAKWLGDSFKELGVAVVAVCLFGWVPLWLIRRYPRDWWLLTSAVLVPFTAFAVLIVPVFVAPLFNDFGPMKDRALEAKILALADRAGIAGGRVFEVNKSVDTKTANAYVTGLLGTKRIVLWDTLLAKFDDREVVVVMGHEMGHYVLNHVAWSIALSAVIELAGLYWVARAGRWAVRRYGARFGFDSLGEAAAVPLLILLLEVSSLALTPVALAYSRHNEAEADRFAVELTRLNRSGARAFADLQRENLGVPYRPLLDTLWRGSHPSIGERIEFFNSYHPWTEGKPGRYTALFAP